MSSLPREFETTQAVLNRRAGSPHQSMLLRMLVNAQRRIY